MSNGNAQGARLVRARKWVLSAVLVAVMASLAFDSGLGTPSAFGVGQFFLLCPLGGLEAMLADRSFIPISAISMGVVLVLALVFGRAWCAWGCPVPVIRKFFKREPTDSDGTGAAPSSSRWTKPTPSAGSPLLHSSESVGAECDGTKAAPSAPSEGGCAAVKQAWGLRGALAHIGHDSRTWALVVVLVATLVAGLPLFCLVCPIGLTFGTVASLWNLFVNKQVTLSCVVFPAALVAEIVVYRRWCLNVCPVAGLLNIAGQFARPFRPRINEQTCLRAQGGTCDVCTTVCAEHINKHAPDAAFQLGECTRCAECVHKCPTASITL